MATFGQNQNVLVSAPLLKVQAEKFGYFGFVGTNKWLDQFKNRHGVTFGKIYDEVKSENMADIVTCVSEKCPAITEGYTKDDIYNGDETGVFYNVNPQRILSSTVKSVSEAISPKIG